MLRYVFAITTLCTLPVQALAADPVPYPENYRTWTHLKSMVIGEAHPLADPFAGIHHVYGNAEAVAGLASGQHSDGAVLVFDLLEALNADGATTEGPRGFIGVMHKDASRYAETGGWGYEVFAGGDPAARGVTDGGAGCHACHEQAKGSGYVFSTYRP